MATRNNDVKVVAFYLPQYHPTPENDAWWGPGFTDWTNVVKGRPLFPGHYQPHVPADLGFYDLRLAATREAQAELARGHGIDAFCYYHYWFDGRRLLAQPLDEVIESGRPAFPFCICWANETWTRAWDGSDEQVLIRGRSSPEDDRAHFAWLATLLRDDRYLRVDDKPLLLIYRVSRLENPLSTTGIWREEARRLGIGDLFLAAVESLEEDRVDPTANGFDATVEFQPDWVSLGPPSRVTVDGTRVFSYSDVVDRMVRKPAVPYRRFPGVTPSWDNTVRRRKGAVVLDGSAPEIYEEWLRQVLARAREANAETLVFVNAWNEWAEGAHLEPCQRWGRGYLEATKRAVDATQGNAAAPLPSRAGAPFVRSNHLSPRTSVCVPAGNCGQYLRATIDSVLAQSHSDLELVVVDDASTDGTPDILASIADPRVRTFMNPVRLGTVPLWNRCLELARGEFVCLLHPGYVIAPDNLTEKVGVLERYGSVGMVHSEISPVVVDATGDSRRTSESADLVAARAEGGMNWFLRLLTEADCIRASSVLVRRESLLRIGSFDASLWHVADDDMWMRLCLFYDVASLDATLVTRVAPAPERQLDTPRGVREGFTARWTLLGRFADRIPGVDRLCAIIAFVYQQRALDHARDAVSRGDGGAAVQYFELATSIAEIASQIVPGEHRSALAHIDKAHRLVGPFTSLS